MEGHRFRPFVMATESVEIGLYQVQADFLNSQAVFRGFVGGRGAGKSFVGSYDLLRRAKPNRLYMIVAPTYKLLKDASFRSFADHARKLRFLKKLNLADLRATLGNGAEIVFRSAENPDSLRGPNLSGCWMDEASYCAQAAYDVVIACLREAGEQGWLAATFTPKGKAHWTYKILGKNIEARIKNKEAGRIIVPIDNNVCLFTARTKDNPFLPPDFDNILRSQYTSKMADQELEGKFMDLGGKLFNRAWFANNIVKASPVLARRVRYWDKAATKDGGCYTCGILLAADYKGQFYVEDVVRGQWSTFTRDETIRAVAYQDAIRYNRQVHTHIETEPGSGGIDSYRETIRKLAGFPVWGHKPRGEKRVRAEPFAAQAEAGNVYLVEPSPEKLNWIPDFLDELESFPDGRADQVDSVSGAFGRIMASRMASPASGNEPSGDAAATAAAATSAETTPTPVQEQPAKPANTSPAQPPASATGERQGSALSIEQILAAGQQTSVGKGGMIGVGPGNGLLGGGRKGGLLGGGGRGGLLGM